MVYGLVFHRSWSDEQLLIAGLAGFIGGALSTILVKFLAYPMVHFLLGIQLRTLILGASSFGVKAAACLGIIGPIEETCKLLAVVGTVSLFGLQTRATAIFLTAVAVGIGFSMVENLDYFELYGFGVFALREVVSSTGHAIFSGIAGLGAAQALPLARSKKRMGALRGFLILLSGLLTASILHGSFNLVAFGLSSETSVPTLMITMFFGMTVLRSLWTRALVLDIPTTPIHWHCPQCETRRYGIERFCNACGARVLPEKRGFMQ